MKVLQSCRESFIFFGINSPPQLNDSLVNVRNSIIVLICATVSVSGIVFFSYKAENIAEYADSFGASWSTALSTINFSTLIYKDFKFMDHLESTINKSNDSAYSIGQIVNKFFNLFYRIDKPSIERNLWKIEPTSREIRKRFNDFYEASVDSMSHLSKVYHKFCCLFYHRFGQWCLWIAIPYLVSIYLFINLMTPSRIDF